MSRRLFDEACPIEVLRAAERGTFPSTLWSAAVEAGMPLALVPEAQGGIGASLADAAVLLREAGRAAAPIPILETMLANRLLAEAGEAPLAGPLGLAFCDVPRATAEIAWGREIAALIVVSGAGAGQLALSRPGEWAVEQATNVAGEARDRLSPLVSGRIVPLPASRAAAGFRAASLLRAAQMLGALDWVLERTVAYAGERKQFGREIGRFQAVQQHLADLAGQVAAAAAITEAALEQGEVDADEAFIAAVRSRLGDSVDAAFAIAHQVHGAIGFSHEYPLNFRTRRLLAWRDEFGSVPEWRRRVAAHFAGLAMPEVWPEVVRLGRA